MVLSKFSLDRKDPSIQQCFKDSNDMHRSVLKLFNASRRDAEVLYRVDRERFIIYILSKSEPLCKTSCPKGFSYIGSTDLSDFTASFSDGCLLNFNILTFPNTKVSREGGNSQRRSINNPEEKLKWLSRKAQQNGFELISVKEEKVIPFTSKLVRGGGSLKFQATEFSGLLRVVNPLEFSKAYENGIGPEKAYGLGMLLISKCLIS